MNNAVPSFQKGKGRRKRKIFQKTGWYDFTRRIGHSCRRLGSLQSFNIMIALRSASAWPTLPTDDASAGALKLNSLDHFDCDLNCKGWKREEGTLKANLTSITATTNRSHIPLIKSKHTSWNRLNTLHNHLIPTNPSRKHDLRCQQANVRQCIQKEK